MITEAELSYASVSYQQKMLSFLRAFPIGSRIVRDWIGSFHSVQFNLYLLQVTGLAPDYYRDICVDVSNVASCWMLNETVSIVLDKLINVFSFPSGSGQGGQQGCVAGPPQQWSSVGARRCRQFHLDRLSADCSQ